MKNKTHTHNKIGNSTQTQSDKPLSTHHIFHCNRCTWWRVWWANRIKSHHVFLVWLKSQRYHFFSALPATCVFIFHDSVCTLQILSSCALQCIAFLFSHAPRSFFFAFSSLFVFINGRINMREMWMVNDAHGLCVCTWNSHNHHHWHTKHLI